MGRPPYCERVTAIKKGPWTPEEDIILVSYIQQHGPGNWRSVPTNTGLLRCSKSCRLRWTNYLRPGIKRGNFTEQEEKTIIHLQALLGNRWAAIATYLPERTDNDIKNFWNTHLRKKLSKTDTDNDDTIIISQNRTQKQNTVKDRWEKRLQTDINMAKQALSDALSLRRTLSNPNYNDSSFPSSSATTTYASSTENISKLLKNWTKPKSPLSDQQQANSETDTQNSFNNNKDSNLNQPIFRFCSANSESGSMADTIGPETRVLQEQSKTKGSLSLIEKWLFDDQGTARSDDQDDFSNMSLENHDGIF